MTDNRLYYPLLVFLLVGLMLTLFANFGTGNPTTVDDAPLARNTVTMVVTVTGES